MSKLILFYWKKNAKGFDYICIFREKLGYNDTEYVDSHSIPRNNTVYAVQWITNTSCIHTSLDTKQNRSGAYSWPIVCLGILQVIYLSDSDRITILPIHFCVIYCSISPFSSIKPIQDRDTLDPISVVIRWRYTLYTVLQFQVTCPVTMDANQHLVLAFSDVLL